MNIKILFSSLLLLSLIPLSVEACPSNGNPNSLAYMRRENNRCEGLLEEKITRPFELISFFTGNLTTTYPNILKMRIPTNSKTQPYITLESSFRDYYLDRLTTRSTPSGLTFELKTSILQKAKIPPQTLRTTAFIEEDSRRVYLPVILGQPSGKYVFIIYSPERTTFPKFEIRSNGKMIHTNPLTIPKQGEILFTWKYGQAAAGRYELYLENDNKKPYRFFFDHNPKLL